MPQLLTEFWWSQIWEWKWGPWGGEGGRFLTHIFLTFTGLFVYRYSQSIWFFKDATREKYSSPMKSYHDTDINQDLDLLITCSQR